ncbi:uncharacterized protein LOC134531347 [Bacillus rossius redtenbacheri]|uniref:uncharacterized protein LOC134531347 n=1 Tax=Bacillus rossius redtenbacheri TaxID=93214 RepID=UPI002FDD7522
MAGSPCDPGVGVDAFFHAIYTHNTRMVMLLGSACSDVTESLANVMPYWNIVQVSFGSTSPALSDRAEFPLFFRTVAPDSSHNPARLALLRRFGWDSVTALSQDEDVYTMAVNDLVTELERANITCPATITFSHTDYKDQLRMLKELDTRIIIGSFSHEVAPSIFCEAFKLGMFGSDYAWILQGGPSDSWWLNASECSQHHLAAAVEGLLLVSSHNSIVGDQPSFSGLTSAQFARLLEARALPVTRYAPQTYDAVWAMALALRGAQLQWAASNDAPSLWQFDYSRRDMARQFTGQLGRLNFLGVSGPVSFSGADRIVISAFYQVQGADVRKVALFWPATGVLDTACLSCVPAAWQGGHVPVARRVFKLRVVTIQPSAFLAVACAAAVGISLAIAFLAFNLHFRKLKYIKLSSPRLNNMVVVGCILVYTAVILLGLDHATLPASSHFPAVCIARIYLLSAGFSLAFGSMFTKTYRVHRIFTRSRSGVVKNKLLQDTQLISLICVLLLIDGLIVTLWVIIDPIQRHLRNLTMEMSEADRSVVYQPQVEVCRSHYTHSWLGALYLYKGLLLVVGVYMAWETRHVKIPALNDSQYIGMSVYSTVITSGIVVVLANLMSERATLAFVTTTTLILTSTTSTLCLLFLPKLHAILRRADCDPVMHSMGLKIECNTRRFLADDRRELYFRVEVQNRVYRRELAALDAEAGRLKRQLLESPPPESSGSSTSPGAASGQAENCTAGDKKNSAERKPSVSVIGGTLPMLLLSVLPPVIPRASWPSTDHGSITMHRQVTFCSEPKLDENAGERSQRDGELFGQEDCESPSKLGVLGKLWSLLGSSRPSSRKTSAASFTGGAGIASALKSHMGYLAGLVMCARYWQCWWRVAGTGSAGGVSQVPGQAGDVWQVLAVLVACRRYLARLVMCGRYLAGQVPGRAGDVCQVLAVLVACRGYLARLVMCARYLAGLVLCARYCQCSWRVAGTGSAGGVSRVPGQAGDVCQVLAVLVACRRYLAGLVMCARYLAGLVMCARYLAGLVMCARYLARQVMCARYLAGLVMCARYLAGLVACARYWQCWWRVAGTGRACGVCQVLAVLVACRRYLAGLVPSSGATVASCPPSCHASTTAVDVGRTYEEHRKCSLAACLAPERRSQPALSARERTRGSPRFPHRVVPACSLGALDLGARCRSLDAHRPGADVWGTAEFGVPLSALGRRDSGSPVVELPGAAIAGRASPRDSGGAGVCTELLALRLPGSLCMVYVLVGLVSLPLLVTVLWLLRQLWRMLASCAGRGCPATARCASRPDHGLEEVVIIPADHQLHGSVPQGRESGGGAPWRCHRRASQPVGGGAGMVYVLVGLVSLPLLVTVLWLLRQLWRMLASCAGRGCPATARCASRPDHGLEEVVIIPADHQLHSSVPQGVPSSSSALLRDGPLASSQQQHQFSPVSPMEEMLLASTREQMQSASTPVS